MRIIIEDDYRSMPAPAPQAAAPQMQAQQTQFAAPTSAGEPAAHVRRFVNSATMAQPATAASAPAEVINIGPAPEWLKRLTLSAVSQQE